MSPHRPWRYSLAAGGLALAWVYGAGPVPAALAAWTLPGSGSASGAASTMPAGGRPSGAATGQSVTVRWSTAVLSNGAAVAGYVVHRYDAASGSPATGGPLVA